MFLSLIVFLSLCGVSFGSTRPHIVMIVADDLGWNDVGLHGSNEIPTPNIDALGFNGIIFDRHYALPWCTPSRAALLTGQYPIRLGYQGRPMNAGEERNIKWGIKTLPSELKNLGYRTHLVGKWHLGFDYFNATALGFGYDSHYGYQNGFIGYFNQKISTSDAEGQDFFSNNVPLFNVSGIYTTDLFTKRAEDIIEDHPKDEPLFLSIHHLAAHTGYTENKEFVLEVRNLNATNEKYNYIEDQDRRMLADVVERMDDSIGRVVKKLKDVNMLDNSIIIFISDNGAPTHGQYSTKSSNFPLRGMKSMAFEGGIRVPAVLYYDKLNSKGRMFDKLFHISDWIPTLYTAAGGDPNVFVGVDGVDQWNNIVLNQNTNVRNEMLVNIDEKEEIYAYIGYGGKYKVIKAPAKLYDNYTGSEGSKQPNYLSRVVGSLVNTAINANSCSKTKEFKALLNKSATSISRPSGEPPSCENYCLFDLLEDPLEFTDISKQHPDIVQELVGQIDYYNTQLVPQYLRDMDARSNPKYCRGTWFFWLEGAKGCYLSRFSVHM